MTVNLDNAALRNVVVLHPWSSVALALAAGGWLALVEPRGTGRRILTSLLGSVVLAALRERAARDLATQARSWIDARTRTHARSDSP